jgi:hypothetical protein
MERRISLHEHGDACRRVITIRGSGRDLVKRINCVVDQLAGFDFFDPRRCHYHEC